MDPPAPLFPFEPGKVARRTVRVDQRQLSSSRTSTRSIYREGTRELRHSPFRDVRHDRHRLLQRGARADELAQRVVLEARLAREHRVTFVIDWRRRAAVEREEPQRAEARQDGEVRVLRFAQTRPGQLSEAASVPSHGDSPAGVARGCLLGNLLRQSARAWSNRISRELPRSNRKTHCQRRQPRCGSREILKQRRLRVPDLVQGEALQVREARDRGEQDGEIFGLDGSFEEELLEGEVRAEVA